MVIVLRKFSSWMCVNIQFFTTFNLYDNLDLWKGFFFCKRKEFISHTIVLVHSHGRRFIVLENQHGRRDVMWKRFIGCHFWKQPTFFCRVRAVDISISFTCMISNLLTSWNVTSYISTRIHLLTISNCLTVRWKSF